MSNKIKYPVGIQTFSEIIEEGYLYVDKTALVYDLVNSNKYVFLSRPRRFGKSLLLSTIEAYFEGCRDLFKGLAVDGLETDWKHHPVLHLSLASERYNNTENPFPMLSHRLAKWEEIYGKNPLDKSLSMRFARVIENAYKQTGKRVVILVDEYEKPLLEHLHDEEKLQYVLKLLQGFYSVIKESDQYIKFAMLTGVTKFPLATEFSGLNNLMDITFHYQYSEICGITEAEFKQYFGESVTNFSKAKRIPEEQIWETCKERYLGYQFDHRGEIVYNPWDILMAFHKKCFGPYWFDTGSLSDIIKIFKDSGFNLSILNKPVLSRWNSQDILPLHYNIVPLLYQSGYLTIKSYDEDWERYFLNFPNLEVSQGFWDDLYNGYIISPTQDSAYDLDHFVEEIEKGKPEEFMQRLQALVASVSPGNSANREVHFQNVLQVIFKMLGFRVQCEVVSSSGRADMIVQTDSYVYIFEFKVDSTAEEALRQICDKGYARPFAADPRKLYLIGASFSTKSNTLEEYIID